VQASRGTTGKFGRIPGHTVGFAVLPGRAERIAPAHRKYRSNSRLCRQLNRQKSAKPTESACMPE